MLDVKKFEIPLRETYKLDAIRAAADQVGNPELGRKTILVAGTNGKGSTCAYLSALFRKSGLNVGTFSSPHVIHRTERIRINLESISEIELLDYEKRYDKILAPLTYFERMTLLAFLIFRDKKVDIQILEVGIGGRLDATNISSPQISVIARIDYDHQDILGKRIEQIAAEKAGILRSECPVFISPQRPEVLRVLKEAAELRRSELIESEKVPLPSEIEDELQRISSEFGPHQSENARLALSAFEGASEIFQLAHSTPKQIVAALQLPLWPARIQVLRERPLFLVDGAHNPNAIQALCAYLQAHHAGTKFHCLFGAMQDKPVAVIGALLSPWIHKIYLPVFYSERQHSPEQIAMIWKSQEFGKGQTIILQELDDCLNELWNQKEHPVLVAGSFYLAGKVLQMLGRGVPR